VGDVLQIIQSAVVLFAAPLYPDMLSRSRRSSRASASAASAVLRSTQAGAQGQRDVRSASGTFHDAPFVAFA